MTSGPSSCQVLSCSDFSGICTENLPEASGMSRDCTWLHVDMGGFSSPSPEEASFTRFLGLIFKNKPRPNATSSPLAYLQIF